MHRGEMARNINQLLECHRLQDRKIYVFGHCDASCELIDLLQKKGLKVLGILDNNSAKYGQRYGEVPVVPPEIVRGEGADCAVCIASRAYGAMAAQLKRLAYRGSVFKAADYNSFARYSLSDETRSGMRLRAERGKERLGLLEEKYPGHFMIFCPFPALGDVFMMRSYLPYFLEKRKIGVYLICVVGTPCAQVIRLFGEDSIEVLSQRDMDETIQAALYVRSSRFFIAHQDRPYVVNLHRALYVKCIPLEMIYCCGVFGLPAYLPAFQPVNWRTYPSLMQIPRGKSVILSPYAKSVTKLPDWLWREIVEDYTQRGCTCFTNVAGDEEPLEGTVPLRPRLCELKSLVEHAGTFIGIRSGLCDVIRYAGCKKTVLYPDYNYCDTKWKAIDMYAIREMENLVVKEGFQWKRN